MGKRSDELGKRLREEALERLKKRRTAPLAPVENDTAALVHDLEVHQTELEVQNEELRRTQEKLTVALDLYEDLYEHAPVGFLTLDPAGVIRQANLAMARLCGRNRQDLIGERFWGAVSTAPVVA